jgi:hypothetical protein
VLTAFGAEKGMTMIDEAVISRRVETVIEAHLAEPSPV